MWYQGCVHMPVDLGGYTLKGLHTASWSITNLAWGNKVPSFQWFSTPGPIGQELQGGAVRVWLWRGYVPARGGLMCTPVHLLDRWQQSWKQTVMKHYFYTTALDASQRHVDAFGVKQSHQPLMVCFKIENILVWRQAFTSYPTWLPQVCHKRQ